MYNSYFYLQGDTQWSEICQFYGKIRIGDNILPSILMLILWVASLNLVIQPGEGWLL
jgi:hypothetical protein